MKQDFRYITTEQISKYHPDKYADQISDRIVGAILSKNRHAKVAVETMVKDTTVILAGEVSGYTTTTEFLQEQVKYVADSLGYEVTEIINLVGEQSEEIRTAVEAFEEVGAGDQGIMFGFATRETSTMMPLGMHVANLIIETLERHVTITEVEPNVFKPTSMLKGDAKTQVTIDTKTNEITKIIVSVCHQEATPLYKVGEVVKALIRNTLYEDMGIVLKDEVFVINPAGEWTIGGPTADSGLTGRKIVADQYGPYVPTGGGAFSGKDFSKVDRSAAYMARLVAKTVLNKNLKLKWCKVHVAYAIGENQPIGLSITTNKGKLKINTQDYKNYLEKFNTNNLYNRFTEEYSGSNAGWSLQQVASSNHMKHV